MSFSVSLEENERPWNEQPFLDPCVHWSQRASQCLQNWEREKEDGILKCAPNIVPNKAYTDKKVYLFTRPESNTKTKKAPKKTEYNIHEPQDNVLEQNA